MEHKERDNSLEIAHIRTTAVRSLKWTMFGEIVSRTVQPITTLILAKVLLPEDFGVVAVAMTVVGLAQLLQDFGLGNTLIQREKEVDKSANIIFWSSLLLSVLLYLVLFFSSPLIARFFHEPKVTAVLEVSGFQVILAATITVHQALLQRNFHFKDLFIIRLLTSLGVGISSVILAFSGFGVWSLVFGALAGSAIQAVLYWKRNPWRPSLTYDLSLSRELFGFSSWVASEALLGWIIIWGDSIVLGHFLGLSDLGIYRVGVTFVTLLFGMIFNPVVPLAYSTFSRLQAKTDELRGLLVAVTRMIGSVSLPIGVILAMLAQPISMSIFGQKWQGIEVVIALIGIKECLAWLVGLNTEIYRAQGRPDINSKLLVVAVIYYIPVYILAAPHGLSIFCVARFAAAFVSIGLHLFVSKRLLNLPFTYLADCIKRPLVAVLALAITIYLLANMIDVTQGSESWLKVIGVVTIGIATYVLALWLLQRDAVAQFWRLARESIR